MELLLFSMIFTYALDNDINPIVMNSIAKVESNFNPKATGSSHGEKGLFQIRPEFSVFTAKQLEDPVLNTIEAVRVIKYVKKHCKHQVDYTWLVCYNAGVTAGSRIKNPKEFPYYKKIMETKKEYVMN